MRLDNKVVLITGGTHGIGRAITELFASEGAMVAFSGRGEVALRETEQAILDQGGAALAIETDIQYKDQVDRMVGTVLKRWGRIDVLVNNAGVSLVSPFLEIAEVDWDMIMNINLKGTFLVSQRVAQVMVQQGKAGSIIQMSSVNGLAAEADQAHYNTTKGGMNMLMMSMALELAPYQIRVNALCPGFIETRLTKSLIDDPQALGVYLKTIPMGRVGQPGDIATAALFLASDDSAYMTGQTMVIDGGQLIKLS